MKGLGPQIKTAVKPLRPLPDKAILWAVQTGYGNMPNGDSSCFPQWQAIKARKSAKRPMPLATFREAVSQAQDRIWIIDQYFLDSDENRQNTVDQILQWLLDKILANDIRILTKSHNTSTNKGVNNDLAKQFQEHAERININRPIGAGKCRIEVRFSLTQKFDYVHDRFAIIDDELWHFGATVGGFHSLVSAATRGWRAADHEAEQFFNLAWDA